MDESKPCRPHQPSEIDQAKPRTLSKKKRRKTESLRRIWSRGLPSLATNTLRMVVATLQMNSIVDEDEYNDDDHHDISSDCQQVLAHIPDIVLNNLNDLIDSKGNILIPNEHTYQHTTLLFLDVSGFTSLTEQYSNDAHLGINQLTHTLNTYFDKLVSIILMHYGDIYKFAGDAILALWTNEQSGPEQALKCAIYLQEKFGTYQTDVGVILRLKIALAYGSVQALFIGTDEFKHYILTGDCVKDVNICEQLCEAGDIILTKAVYEQVKTSSIQCEYSPIEDEINEHIAVKYLGSIDDDQDLIQINDILVNSNNDLLNETHRSSSSLLNDLIDDDFYNKIDNLMPSFLLRCVYQRIERKQSLDYLSELRRVTITFINLDISNNTSTTTNLCENLQKIFIHIYELTKMMGGVLTKALLFDKGWSFLCVFGLPGYKQGDDTANALKCASMIHSTLFKQYSFIRQCSIGVTTGLTYCGVVGHVARCEYTVIGRKVNMAARLMCNYPNIISCDQETYYNSRLNSRLFQILPDKILKGMHNVGLIWQYDNHQHTEQINENRTEYYPLLGRRVELMIVATQIMLLDESVNKRRDLAAIIFEGDDKIGRSRLLQFIVDSLEKTVSTDVCLLNENISIKKSSIRIIHYSCQLEQRFNEFNLLSSLLRQLLQFHFNDLTQYEREQYLLRLFDLNKSSDVQLKRNLFLLNDFLDVNFRRSQIEADKQLNQINLLKTSDQNITDLLLHILNQFIETSINTNESNISCSSQRLSSSLSSSSIPIVSKILFIIDDIHFADESSLKYLLTLGSHNKCLLILSMKPPTNNNNDRPASDTLRSISTDSRVYLRKLPGLELRYLATLGCQILGVHKLPGKLVKILNENCNGIPGFCEQILFDLLRHDKIYITDSNQSNEEELNLLEGDADKLIRISSNQSSLFKTLFSRRKCLLTSEQRQKHSIFSRICLLRDPNTNDFTAHCQQNFQNYIMCRIDRLSEGESLLVKIAAVIGNTYSRSFLWHLVEPQSKKLINFNSCILDMMQRTVIECAYQQQQIHPSRMIKCFCLQNPGGFPSQCRLMAFSHVSIREGIYNSLMENLKRLITRNAIEYLENQCTILCLTCGPRNENPFFVQKQDDLTRRLKSHSQHTFIDIVKLVALRDIDNNIKQIVRFRSLNSRTKLRSNTSSNLPAEPNTAPVGISHQINDYGTKTIEKRRNSYDTNGFDSCRIRRSLSPFRLFTNEDNQEKTSSNRTSINECLISSENEKNLSMKSKHRFLRRIHQFFCCLFCRTLSSTNSIEHQSILEKNLPELMPKRSSHWLKVRQALISSSNKTLRSCPNDRELLDQPMFTIEIMKQILFDLDFLNKHIYLTRTFENLYEQSNIFYTFQSYVKYKNLIEYVYQSQTIKNENFEMNLNDYLTFNDLRLCQCIDYVLTVYIKLVEYHTNLYDMYETNSLDDRRDFLRRKQFDRICYYRIEICQIFLHLNYLQRLLVEIENGRKFLFKYQNEIVNQDNQYQCLLIKYTYNLFEAIVLQRTRSLTEAKLLVEQSLNDLKNLRVDIDQYSIANDKRMQYIQKKTCSIDASCSSDLSQFVEKYHLEYLICRYYLLQYHLSRHQSIESLHRLIDLKYHTYPLIFSLPCTIILIEYFYSQMNYQQCLILIENMIVFWWPYISSREKLELAKLKSLSLIIELKQSSLESAILSGYFAKRLLTGYHENIFLIETCIHLTLALIGEMRISNIELILQHLEYLSEQTMNCYTKFWYYILIVDVAIELGYELLPITIEFLENLTKYRKKLLTGPNQQSLLIVYSDCTLAQIYIRLGILNLSKIHFQQALHQIKYDQMHLSNIDFRFKRALLKLVETQLLYWYYTKENEEFITKESFLFHVLEEHLNEQTIPWNRTRFFIYQAYYDRLINDCKRKGNYFIDNDFNWRISLFEAEKTAIKLDLEWIKRLRLIWSKPLSEQYFNATRQSLSTSRIRTSTVGNKSSNRPLIRPSMPYVRSTSKIEKTFDEQTLSQTSQQIFLDWRLFLTQKNLPQFQLYLLPVRV